MKDLLHWKERLKVQPNKGINEGRQIFSTGEYIPQTQLGKDLMDIRHEILEKQEDESAEEIQQYMDDQRRRQLYDNY
jgi:hypothetical protein